MSLPPVPGSCPTNPDLHTRLKSHSGDSEVPCLRQSNQKPLPPLTPPPEQLEASVSVPCLRQSD